MTVYIRNGGAWYAAPSGKIAVKDGGAWKTASFCKIRQGGAWYDSGYRGYPNPPQNIRVASWDFGQVTPYWDAPAAGAAPVSYYQVVKTDANGNWVTSVNTSSQSYSFGVSQDERCQFYVSSWSTGGLQSAWNGPLRVQIGHTQLSHTVTDTLTRPWSTGMDVNGYRNTTQLLYVPSSVNISSWYFNLSCTFSTGVISPTASRIVSHIFANVAQGQNLNWSNPLQGWYSYTYNGQNSWWGFWVDGTGWSQYGDGAYRVVGRFEQHGTETYYQDRTVIDRNYADNSYW